MHRKLKNIVKGSPIEKIANENKQTASNNVCILRKQKQSSLVKVN